ncbi:hypothetical protein OUZ56_010001 [Daphnia magna]|uniref:Uncharacterized protein n=1 Tax=Daphnia magna TaxID=35525 RepID=A0ABR0AHN9_9CRUS|nr:hypothetical protein OUZ56_010001 [Daphnia magna]
MALVFLLFGPTTITFAVLIMKSSKVFALEADAVMGGEVSKPGGQSSSGKKVEEKNQKLIEGRRNARRRKKREAAAFTALAISIPAVTERFVVFTSTYLPLRPIATVGPPVALVPSVLTRQPETLVIQQKTCATCQYESRTNPIVRKKGPADLFNAGRREKKSWLFGKPPSIKGVYARQMKKKPRLQQERKEKRKS